MPPAAEPPLEPAERPLEPAEPPAAPDLDPGELVALALETATAAGRLVLDGLARRRRVTATKSSPTDVVTEVDRASERLIVDRLRRARPDDAVLGEEDGGRPGRSGVRWLVDPIDGTVNYLYGHPGFAISIAAEVGGRVVAGVVLDPGRAEAFSAVEGRGAERDGRPIGVNDTTLPREALVATGFSYRPERRRRQGRVLAHVLPRVRDIRRVGSAALDLCSVACGRVDAFYEVGLQPWDRAAGELIAREAGAVVTDLSGRHPPGGRTGLLAAPPLLHGALVRLLADAQRRAMRG